MSENIIWKRVKLARERCKPKITQGVFLEKTAISKIESGKRPISDIELIAFADAL